MRAWILRAALGMKAAQAENVIGVFAGEADARAAVRFLEHAGFHPDSVAVVSSDVRRARELTGSRSLQGAALGLLVSLIAFALFVALGGAPMRSSPVALVLGLVVFAVAGTAIGTLAGRGRLFVSERGARYEDTIAAGGTLVSVHVTNGERDRARQLLREAGAVRIQEEGTIEAA